jgi:hypothetical protein
METIEKLIALNSKIGESEKNKDVSFFQKHLSENLLFVRASGKLNSKKEFIDAVQNKNLIYHKIDTQVVKAIISEDNSKAFVKAIVKAKINNEGKEIDGYYMNIRFFELVDETWMLINWYNYEL